MLYYVLQNMQNLIECCESPDDQAIGAMMSVCTSFVRRKQ